MLVFKKATVYKPVSSWIGKSNGICLKFLQGGNIERGGINIVVQQFFLVTHCPQDLKMVLSSLFLFYFFNLGKEYARGECVNRNLKQILKKKIQKGREHFANQINFSFSVSS